MLKLFSSQSVSRGCRRTISRNMNILTESAAHPQVMITPDLLVCSCLISASNHSLVLSPISLQIFLGSRHGVAQLMKYNFSQAILPESVGTSINFLKDDAAQISRCPMVRSLFRIDTVEQILITRDSVTVTKSGLDPW